MEYKFSGRLTKDFPSQIMVDITEVCNLACIHCTHPEFKKSKIYTKAMLDEELNHKMVQEVAKYGKGKTAYIRYTSNGEPLVHPKSYDIIYDAVKNSGTKVTLTTNGTILNEKRIKKLMNTGLHMIDVSIDAFNDDTYKKIRINGDLKVTRKNVINLLKFKNEINANTKIIVSFVEQSSNSSEVEEFKNFWNDQGTDEVLIRRLHTNSGSNLVNDKTNNLSSYQNKKENDSSRRACLYPWERVVLTAKGYLAFCPTDWFGKTIIADYREETIKNVWQGSFYKELRNEHLSCKFKNEFCKNCPDWKNTSWPHDKNKSYADLVERVLNEEENSHA
jgi:molybdenum cofactor biosynthesis enzyme MoaA